MESLLKQKLSQVTRRFQNGRFAFYLLVFWAILLTLAVVAHNQGMRIQNTFGFTIAFLVTTTALVSIAFFLSRLAYRNESWIANQIETHFQTLEQRLITLLEKPVDSANTASLFFRRQLLKETLDHSQKYDWRESMPSAWFNQMWFAQSVLLFILIFVCSNLLLPKTESQQSPSTLLSKTTTTSLIVEPGNIDIEKGSNVVFTARFEGPLPAEVLLETTHKNSTEKTSQALRRNLKDPIFGGVIMGIDTPLTYRIAYNDTVSQPYQINVFEYPKVIRSDAKIVAPSYAQGPEKLVEDTRRVTVAEGSQLTWILHLNKPVVSVELTDKSGTTHALNAEADKPTMYSYSIQLKESNTWKIQLIDQDGRKNKFPEELTAKVLPNNPPTIKIAKASDRRVSPLEEMDIGAKLNDDFGIAKIGLAYAINGDEPTEVILSSSDEASKKVEASHLLALEQLKAKPDQLISYYIWAEDKDSDGLPRRVESDLFFAEVRPFEEIYREGESQSASQQQQQQQQQGGAQQQAEEAAELQRQIIVAIWNILRRETTEKPSETFDADLQVIAESQATVIEKLAEIQQSANTPDAAEIVAQIQTHMENVIKYLGNARESQTLTPIQNARAAAQSAYAGLLQLRAREHEISRSQQQQSQSQSRAQQNRQQQLNELELNNDPNRYESQQTPPEPEEEQQAQEVRQAINRLKELAQRQEDLNEELQKIQAELEKAESEEEKQNLQEQLDRLRDAQEELLRDADELKERMNEANQNEAMEQARQQMEQARENVRQATESLENKDPNEALAAGTRAEREFEQMRDELRQQSANQFADRMKDMVQQSRELNEKQKQLNEKATQEPQPEENSGLRAESTESQLPQELKDQSQQLTKLLDQMQQTVTEAETSEPLLADKLYDSFRETKQQNIEENLQQLSQLAEQGVEVGRVPETQRFLDQATQGIDRLQQQVEAAANSVLGSEEESLRRALRELNEAADDVNQELRTATGREATEQQENPNADSDPANQENSADPASKPQGQGTDASGTDNQQQQQQSQPSDASQPSQESDPSQELQQPANQPTAQAQPSSGERESEPRNASDQPRRPSASEASENEPSPNQPSGRPNPQAPNSQAPNSQAPNSQAPNSQGPSGNRPEDSSREDPARERAARTGRENLLDQIGQANSAAPISGDDFLEFSDRLRDVEEILDDPELQSQVARIREAARDIRREARKHAADPQWSLVERLVANPLRDLRVKLQEELLRKTAAKNSLVPIDRDPVPSEFEKAQQKYYENLGSGKR
jgi:hypothetical protein